VATFDEFVKQLGPNADRYTPGQLRQLYIDVRRLAQIFVGIIQAERRSRAARSPQPRLDPPGTDRTLTSTDNCQIPATHDVEPGHHP